MPRFIRFGKSVSPVLLLGSGKEWGANRPLRRGWSAAAGRFGGGHGGSVIPCAPSSPLRGDNVETIPLKPSATALQLSHSSTVSTGRGIAQYG
ncbi:hypothetical protein [Nitrosomonas communis]|uniref:Uncharacterized protein n=1 Tax=Nitrosomonas communis TaxID=44574 RepID=A0A1I4TB07_9PROT|nr:hypothetical protein [Nitrosomonas communis]SFM73968.1 hypothetical protein SAMN05421863_10492 [Nitrosomonas communis]